MRLSSLNVISLVLISISQSLSNQVQNVVVHYNCIIPGHYAITFDDGPHPTLTPRLLDLLQARNVKATFFIMGPGRFEKNPVRWKRIVRRAYSEGHQIGSHTWSHKDLTELRDNEIHQELMYLEKYISLALNQTPNVRPKAFRPPFMSYDDRVLRILGQVYYNYDVINDNINTEDVNHPGNTEAGLEGYVNAVNSNKAPSYIAVHHDVLNGSVELAAAAIDFMTFKGFKSATIAECIGSTMYQ